MEKHAILMVGEQWGDKDCIGEDIAIDLIADFAREVGKKVQGHFDNELL